MRIPRKLAVGAAAAAASVAVLVPSAAEAHSLESSTISTHVTDDGVDATITIALESLDTALGTDLAAGGIGAQEDAVVAYLADHLTVTDADGAEWGETFTDLTLQTVEGIDSVSVDVTFDTGDSSTSTFDIDYDAVIEAVPGHEAVVVLTDPDGEVSTPGVISSVGDTVTVSLPSTGGDSETSSGATGLLDMVRYGFHHVLQGADHLLFLLTLLLVAPVVLLAGRWHRRDDASATIRSVLGLTTAFTVGHSVTLIASALGWVQVPSQPVEVLVAASVGVAGLHAIRPIFSHGERWIAAAFGLVHGLAFAGILVDLGLDGSTGVVSLLAFNVGVELAQLAVIALVFPSLFALSRTRAYGAVRAVGGLLALTAATTWVLDRLGFLDNPLGSLEGAAITHPWPIVVGLALLAATAWCFDSHRSRTANSPAPPSQQLNHRIDITT